MNRYFFLAFFLLISCNKENVDPCSEPVACTDEIRTLYVSVSDISGVAIPLDDFTVYDVNRNLDITPEYTRDELRTFRAFNAYPLFSDTNSEGYVGKQHVLRFQGYREGNLIARREFLAGANCCHVQLYDGDQNIVLD